MGLTERKLWARTIVGFELGGGGAGGLAGLAGPGQFIVMLTTLGDLGGGDGFLDGGAPRPVIPGPAGGTGLVAVGFDSSGGGFGARLCLPKFNVGGFVGMLGGFRLMPTLSVESFYKSMEKKKKS